MKSCARPTCVPLEETTKACPVLPADVSQLRAPIVLKTADEVRQEEITDQSVIPSVGKVRVIQGSVSIVNAEGTSRVVSGAGELHEGERVEAGKDSGAIVDFAGGNKVHLHADTSVGVQEYKNEKLPESRRVLLNLIKGKIRNQVEQKYNGRSSYYRVTTKVAVAGVRGTVFVMEHKEQGAISSRVETLSGKVNLSNLDETESRAISRGQGAVLEAPIPAGDAGGAPRGKLSDIYSLSSERMKELERDSRVDVATARAKSAKINPDVEICAKPKGKYNQCLWKCEGNPGGEKACRTDIPGVRCTRSRCNANGIWAEETSLGGKATLCPSAGEIVKDCDY